MKLFTLAVAIAPLALASSLPANLPFNLTYLFTAELALGPPNAPITIPGGVRIAEAIVNGTVSGPALNGTIIGGLAVPAVYENQTVQAPIIEAYGASKDGVTFRLHEEGIGSPQAQVTRIVSGRYTNMPRVF